MPYFNWRKQIVIILAMSDNQIGDAIVNEAVSPNLLTPR
jgi:hypothetical protein